MCAGGLARGNGDWPGTAGGIARIIYGRAGIAGGIRLGAASTGRPVICRLIALGLSIELVLPVHCGEIVEAAEGKVGEWRFEPSGGFGWAGGVDPLLRPPGTAGEKVARPGLEVDCPCCPG